MAFLFATSFYLFSIILYSISHCLSIGGTEGSPADAGWDYGIHAGFGESRAAAPNFGEICNRFNFLRVQKWICLFCKGIDPACFGQSTTSTSSTTPVSTTTELTTKTQATTTPATTNTATTEESGD